MSIILEVNSKLIRKRLEDAGLKVCVCSTFDQSVWLCCSDIDYNIHGIGYFSEEYSSSDVEDLLNQFLSENKEIIDCNFNVNKFIEHCIKLKNE